MKMTASTRLALALAVAAALAIAFWMLLLSPERDEAKQLGKQVTKLEQTLAQHREEVSTALEARKRFPANYQQLVVLGKAVPGDDDTPSLLVQLNRIAESSHVSFLTIKLSGEGSEEAAAASEPEATGSEGASAEPSLVPPTEVAASTLPLGAQIGPAGLDVMPYELTFEGRFFSLADFIKGLDSLVRTENEKLSVNGRLLTINGFSLKGFPKLQGEFSMTSYLTPPEQGVTAGATETGPATSEATPASTTTGGTP
jgi:Tfp pilus assembly protein PilO